jgi:protein-S-isoprenylcysteine O-methyltransferase Ste14
VTTVLPALWLLWLLSWLLAAGWSVRTVVQQSSGARLIQGVPVWLGALLLFRSPGRALGAPLYARPPWMVWVTVILTILGFAMTWWARISLGRFWSAAVTLKAEHALVRSGPYAMTRHPIYTGLLLAVLASAVARASPAGFVGAGLIALGLVLKLRQEEEFLRAKFGPAYEAYTREVSALIPGL